jgi:hypothetical protein
MDFQFSVGEGKMNIKMFPINALTAVAYKTVKFSIH